MILLLYAHYSASQDLEVTPQLIEICCTTLDLSNRPLPDSSPYGNNIHLKEEVAKSLNAGGFILPILTSRWQIFNICTSHICISITKRCFFFLLCNPVRFSIKALSFYFDYLIQIDFMPIRSPYFWPMRLTQKR